MRLTAHFELAEFRCHDGTGVPAGDVDELRRLCRQLLEPLREAFGPVVIISGYRTRRYNRQVGGAMHSWHVYNAHQVGVAADVRCRRGTPLAWYTLLDRKGAGGLGLYDGHVHVDSRPGHSRWRETSE